MRLVSRESSVKREQVAGKGEERRTQNESKVEGIEKETEEEEERSRLGSEARWYLFSMRYILTARICLPIRSVLAAWSQGSYRGDQWLVSP
jgi:hypothetical protein